VVPDGDELSERIDGLEKRMRTSIERLIEDRRRSLESHERLLGRAPILNEYTQHLDELEEGLDRGIGDAVEDARSSVEEKARLLESVSPLKVLSRGYSVVESDDGVVESIEDVSGGDGISIRLVDGKVKATVQKTAGNGTDEQV